MTKNYSGTTGVDVGVLGKLSLGDQVDTGESNKSW